MIFVFVEKICNYTHETLQWLSMAIDIVDGLLSVF
jgi:hypothetical protein